MIRLVRNGLRRRKRSYPLELQTFDKVNIGSVVSGGRNKFLQVIEKHSVSELYQIDQKYGTFLNNYLICQPLKGIDKASFGVIKFPSSECKHAVISDGFDEEVDIMPRFHYEKLSKPIARKRIRYYPINTPSRYLIFDPVTTKRLGQIHYYHTSHVKLGDIILVNDKYYKVIGNNMCIEYDILTDTIKGNPQTIPYYYTDQYVVLFNIYSDMVYTYLYDL